MSAESVIEVAVYMHKFHNLDLFQQGWYRIKVTSRWEGLEDSPGFPSRVVQYEDVGPDDSTAIWQINDADKSFCSRPFRIKYARQDIFLAVMISFNLFLRSVEKLLINAVLIRFELLYAPIAVLSTNMNAVKFLFCAENELRVPPKTLLGIHAYCPLHFDTWHMVLVDVTVHSVLLKVNFSTSMVETKASDWDAVGKEIVNPEAVGSQCVGSEAETSNVALWKALYASRNILKHELEALGSAIQQHVGIEVAEHLTVTSLVTKLPAYSLESNDLWHLMTNVEMMHWKKDDSRQVISKNELLVAFQDLGNEVSALWNGFLKFHRSNRSPVWEYLRGVWTEERNEEWSMWLIHSNADVQVNGNLDNLGRENACHMESTRQFPSKNYYDPAVMSSSQAELRRKTLEEMKGNSRALQDMNIFGNPSQLPILYVEHRAVPCERSGPDGLLARAPDHGRVLRVVVFVHGFQGHHLDLRLVRNHWLLIDPTMEYLMSETNEDRTTSDFRELGKRLAEEVSAFLKSKFNAFFKGGALGNCRLSFVGHSIGNIIIRAALTDIVMEPFLQYLYTFLSISGPHLGYLYSSNALFNSGFWLLKKFKASASMHQLTFTDQTDIRDCFLFKLSQMKTFGYFHHVLLLSSPQDRYVPYHSARIESCQAATHDSKRGPFYMTMVHNCLHQIMKPLTRERRFIRCDVNFNVSAQSRTLNSLIGRTAHIEFLETDAFLRFLMWTFPKMFS
eukprot:c28018_g1_i1 orf=264-2459(-)